MKKLFSLLTLALLTMSAWAASTVLLDFTAQGYANQQEVSSLTVGGVTVAFDKGTNSNTPKYYTSGNSVRVYGGGTVTVSTSGSDPITAITFTYGSSDGTNAITSDVGTFVSPDWTGSSNAVVFSIGGTTGNRRFAKVEVTLGGEVVETIADPEITPASGSFTDSVNVAITCGTSGATIEYSTDNLTWSNYSVPITIKETTTVYARATKGNLVSNVVSATYTKIEPVTGNLVAFDPAKDKGDGSTTRNPWTITKNGVTIYCSDGTVYDENYRIYQGAHLRFSTNGEIGNIVKIEFIGTTDRPCSNLTLISQNGAYSTADVTKCTWTGSEADSVVFNATAQARASQINVYVDGELPVVTVAAPSLPASQEFEESMTVTITNNEEGADLYYKTTGDWTAYTEALTITETTTVYAKAVKGDNESEVVSATYTKVEPVAPITTLAMANALADKTVFTFEGTDDVVVTYQNGKYTFLRDATGHGEFYQEDATSVPELVNGQVLNSGWSATRDTYKGLPEYKNATNVTASDRTNAELAKPIEISELSNGMINAYVTIKNIKQFNYSGSGKYFTVTLADDSEINGYNQFNVNLGQLPTTEGDYTAIGVVGIYNNLQFWIISWEGQGTPEPEPTEVHSIADAINVGQGNKFSYADDVAATFQHGKYLFIRDENGKGGLIYGDVDTTFETGDVLGADWVATVSEFHGAPQFTNPNGVTNSGDKWTVEPYERETLTAENLHEYVIMKGQSIVACTDTTNQYMEKTFYNANGMVLFNQFGVDMSIVEEGKTYDVVGIATVRDGEVQMYIISLTETASAVVRGDVTGEGEVNMDDLAALINYLLTDDASLVNVANAAACDGSDGITLDDLAALINYLLTDSWD